MLFQLWIHVSRYEDSLNRIKQYKGRLLKNSCLCRYSKIISQLVLLACSFLVGKQIYCSQVGRQFSRQSYSESAAATDSASRFTTNRMA